MEVHIQAQFDYLNLYLNQYSKQLESNIDLLSLFNEKLSFFRNQISSIYTKKKFDLSTQTQKCFRSSILSLIEQVQNDLTDKLNLFYSVVNQITIQNSEIKQIQNHTLSSNKQFETVIKTLDEKLFKFEKENDMQSLPSLKSISSPLKQISSPFKSISSPLKQPTLPLKQPTLPLKQIKINFLQRQTENLKNQNGKQLYSNYFQSRKINFLNDLKTSILQDRKLKTKQIVKNKKIFIGICQEFLKHIEKLIKKINQKKPLLTQRKSLMLENQQKKEEKYLEPISEFQLRVNDFVEKQKEKDGWLLYSPIDKLLQKRLKSVILQQKFEICQEKNKVYVCEEKIEKNNNKLNENN